MCRSDKLVHRWLLLFEREFGNLVDVGCIYNNDIKILGNLLILYSLIQNKPISQYLRWISGLSMNFPMHENRASLITISSILNITLPTSALVKNEITSSACLISKFAFKHFYSCSFCEAKCLKHITFSQAWLPKVFQFMFDIGTLSLVFFENKSPAASAFTATREWNQATVLNEPGDHIKSTNF